MCNGPSLAPTAQQKTINFILCPYLLVSTERQKSWGFLKLDITITDQKLLQEEEWEMIIFSSLQIRFTYAYRWTKKQYIIFFFAWFLLVSKNVCMIGALWAPTTQNNTHFKLHHHHDSLSIFTATNNTCRLPRIFHCNQMMLHSHRK
jgi:hypothetical protein